MEREKICCLRPFYFHLSENLSAKVSETVMDCLGDVPRLGLPFGCNLHFVVVFFVLRKRSAGEEDLGVEVFPEAVEGGCWFAVWPAGCGYKLETEANDGGEGFWYGRVLGGEVMHSHVRGTSEVVPGWHMLY